MILGARAAFWGRVPWSGRGSLHHDGHHEILPLRPTVAMIIPPIEAGENIHRESVESSCFR
jgi:hypothetical protein